MGDEFVETDLETPTEHDVDDAYGSRFLGVVDVGDKKIRSKLVKVRNDNVKDRESGRMKKRILVFFEGIDKALVLNTTNKNTLVDALGKPPAGWIGAKVGIFVDPNVGFGGKTTGGVRLRVLLPPAKPTPAPAAAKPAPATAPESDWSEQGDPGPNWEKEDA